MQFLKGKNILIISPEGWGKSFLSKHHYAIELAKSNRVWFLNPGHTCVTNDQAGDLPENLTLINDRQIPGLRHYPQRIQRFIISKQFDQIEKKTGVKFQVVWNFDNSRYFHHDCFYDAYTIHHVVDDHMNYNFAIASRSAELCLGVTHELVESLKRYNQHAHFIDHALAPFENTGIQKPPGKGKWSVSYTGNLLLQALDLKLITDLAEEHADTDFYLIGSYGKSHLNVGVKAAENPELTRLMALPNVFATGELGFKDAFTLASQTDIQIVPYFRSDKPMTNSSKLPFYLYNGKVIVSNHFSEHRHHGLIRMASTPSEFKTIFNETLKNLGTWNSTEKMEQRKQYALSNTYQNRIEYIDKLITEANS